jgi:hypothetical protein
MRLWRLNITRSHIFWYTPRRTLSFTWRTIWQWLPSWGPFGCNGGWLVCWGWFLFENDVHDEDDPWGERKWWDRLELFASIDDIFGDEELDKK